MDRSNEVDKGCPLIRMGVSGWVLLLVVLDQRPLNGCVCVFKDLKSPL